MHHHLYFNQDCPICRRGMRVPIEWFGSEIRCVRCSGGAGRRRAVDAPSGSSQVEREPSRRVAAHEPDRTG